ncbi:PfkB family carbohydrate kinase [Actinoallomurus purpureus]|uniref:PfkB family carbohydrate kinase n=1 Tax=Actinoallomurus purpureus TaxID=478114 RepID=UPI00209341CC|nr:PfkB family carbohydrate kinase [Actinoallomurus purpureus]MCO6011666.1 PfkB family carbohydrate kinase [Actinoallomurus purpureus]
MIIVFGEALIDLVPAEGPDQWRAMPGGGPANTAVALARLGTPVALACRLRGAGSMPAFLRIAHTVAGPMRRPSLAISPVIRLYPHVGFSVAIFSTKFWMAGRVGGRPCRRRL